jgi:hypothetical protein
LYKNPGAKYLKVGPLKEHPMIFLSIVICIAEAKE